MDLNDIPCVLNLTPRRNKDQVVAQRNAANVCVGARIDGWLSSMKFLIN